MDPLGSSHERHTSDRSGTGQLLPSATQRPWEARNGSDRSPRQQQTVQPPLQPELRQEQVKKTSRKITLLEIENKRLYTYCDKNRRQQETNRIDKSSAV